MYCVLILFDNACFNCTSTLSRLLQILDRSAKSTAAGPDALSKKVDYATAVLDLGLLLQALYLEHSSESNLSSGWSRGSLHYASVESAVSRHLAATSSKLLQEASEVVQKALRSSGGNISTPVPPSKPTLSKKLTATLLGMQTKAEYALGHLSLAISAESLRMSTIASATTSKVDEMLVVKLHNKSRLTQAHGLDILQNVLPATAAQLSSVLDALEEDLHDGSLAIKTSWEKYCSELNNFVLLCAASSNNVSPKATPSVRGIGIGNVESTDTAGTSNKLFTLPETLSCLLDKLIASKVEADAALLVAEHFVQQAVNRKLGEVNATFVHCMAPPTPTPPVSGSREAKEPASFVPPPSSSTALDLPVPKGVQRETSSGLIPESGSGAPTAAKSAAESADKIGNAGSSKKKISNNIMFPILLHNGRLDLLRELLDREFLVHQQKFLDKMTEQQDALNVSSLVESSSSLPSPVNSKSPPRSGAAGAANPLLALKQGEPSLLFTEELTAEEEAEIAALSSPVADLPATKFSNAALVHCWRVSQRNYDIAVHAYLDIFGPNSIIVAEARILQANLYRHFGRDDEAKPLYEQALKVFKAQAVATFQQPIATTAHCWLGLASYFDQHSSVLGSVYESRTGVVNSAAHKSKSDLALRLYDEAFSIYQCTFPSTHFAVGLTAEAVVGVLTGLKRYGRAITLLNDCIDSTKLVLARDRIMQRYLNRQLRLLSRKPSNGKKNSARNVAVNRLERSIESNELALQSTIGYLGGLLVSLARLHDHNKQHHLAIVLYKEAIVCFRELRLSIIRKYQAILNANGGSKPAKNATTADGIEEEEVGEMEQIITNQPERELALRIAQTMRDLSQSLFDEGVKQMGGRRSNGLSLPDFQYRHALYVINRYVTRLCFLSFLCWISTSSETLLCWIVLLSVRHINLLTNAFLKFLFD